MPSIASTNVSIFSRRVVAPIVAVVLFAFALVVWMLFDIARNQDAAQANASVEFVGRAWKAREDAHTKVLGDYAAWGAAYENLHVRLNKSWAYDEDNLGRATAKQFGFAYIFVISPSGRAVYSVIDGALAERQPSDAITGDVEGLISKARTAEDFRPVAATLSAGADPVIAVAAVITPGTDPNVKMIEGPPSVLIVGERLTPTTLSTLSPSAFLSRLRLARNFADAATFPSLIVGGPTRRLFRFAGNQQNREIT